ncbi:MAG: hypothetical protein BXU00_03450 [Candidatus Nanoclepta minutus]|uniref:Uncharacterized protein n=1 Tax=Candidatus Nanoclepta minutus TaxID=1940235 RepID=A0A397WLV3_9ARCH|nr:MAG: hypothetical protein BXU00_03450 [Candidatus Nanoclepta minutus]
MIKKDIIFLCISMLFLVIFNLLFISMKIDFEYLKITVITLILTMILFSLSIYLSEKIKNKLLLILNILIQILFSIRYYYLSIFLIPLILLIFRDGSRSIDLSKNILFLIFFFLPAIHPEFSSLLIDKSFSLFNLSVDKIAEGIIKEQVSVEVRYAKNLILQGYDFAVQNLPISNYSMAIELRGRLSDYIDNMKENLSEIYMENYKEVIKNEITESINRYKIFISMAISLAIFTTVYLYLLFIKAYYLAFKNLLDKYL